MGEGEKNPAKVTNGSCHCGAVDWRFEGDIPYGLSCNCTVCRRYGVLWAYHYDGYGIHVDDPRSMLTSYVCGERTIAFDFCRTCGNLVSWRALKPSADGRTRIAVNLRLAEPEDVADIPLRRSDGLRTFEDLPPDGRHISHVWF